MDTAHWPIEIDADSNPLGDAIGHQRPQSNDRQLGLKCTNTDRDVRIRSTNFPAVAHRTCAIAPGCPAIVTTQAVQSHGFPIPESGRSDTTVSAQIDVQAPEPFAVQVREWAVRK